VTVLNHRTGERRSSTGSKRDCERFADEVKREWKPEKKLEIVIEKR